MLEPLVVEQHVRADPDSVYAAWLSPERLAEWWWPHLPDTTYEVDPRVGGTYAIWSAEAGIGCRGEFLVLDEPQRIAMTFEWLGTEEDQSVVERVEIAFDAVDGGTLVRLTHVLDESVDSSEGQRQGWTHVLSRLAETAAASG